MQITRGIIFLHQTNEHRQNMSNKKILLSPYREHRIYTTNYTLYYKGDIFLLVRPLDISL